MKSLKDVKAGDKVVYTAGRRAYSFEMIKEVSRITKTQIVTTDGKKFRKSDGTGLEGDSIFSANKIRVLEEEEENR